MGGSGGSGGNGHSGRPSPAELKTLLRDVEDKAKAETFKTRLNAEINSLLNGYNTRDTKLINDRLEDIKRALGDELDHTVDALFGGSVAKKTYVDGISDVDFLILLKKIEKRAPADVIEQIKACLDKQVDGCTVNVGKLAVTLTYSDGMVLQLLPASCIGNHYRIPDADGAGWSKINPEGFFTALTKVNQSCDGKVVPTIKLAKAINDIFPEELKIKGYHMESIAIKAFRDYKSTKDYPTMLTYFFEKAKEIVKTPIKDSTGQSVYVDEYLGNENSQERMRLSQTLDRTLRRMRNATTSEDISLWLSLFGEN